MRVIVLCAVLVLGAALSAEEPAEEVVPLSFDEAMARGDAAVERREYTRALNEWKLGFERYLTELRGYEFRKPVPSSFLTRAKLKEFLLEEIAEEYPAEYMEMYRKSLLVFGYAGPEFDPATLIPELYTQEIGGFYDPEKDSLFLISETQDGEAEKQTFLGKLLGGESFDATQNKTILVHELSHALMDQHFDLDEWQERVKHDDDAMLAYSALIEGEATVTMFAYAYGMGREFLRTPASSMELFSTSMEALVPLGGDALRSAPAIVSEQLIFPYSRGAVFVLTLANRTGDWRDVNRAFTEVPISTEQILHPEKLWDAADPPLAVDLPDLAAAAGAGWRRVGLVDTNVIGEMALASLLEQKQIANSDAVAAGWGGDGYQVLEDAKGRLGLVFRTTWDTATDAIDFVKAWRQYQRTRAADGAALASSESELVPLTAAAGSPFGEGTVLTIELRGKQVLIIEGFPAERRAALAERAWTPDWRAKKFAKTNEAPK